MVLCEVCAVYRGLCGRVFWVGGVQGEQQRFEVLKLGKRRGAWSRRRVGERVSCCCLSFWGEGWCDSG